MLETKLDILSYWKPIWIVSLSPFLGIALLLFVEKWLLSSPKTLPWWGGLKTGLFPKIAACLRDKDESVSGLISAYAIFGSKGKPWVKPDAAFMPEIMVPREYIQWVLNQPQDMLGIHEPRYEKFALDFVLPGHDDAVDRVFLDTIHRKMTRNLLNLQGAFAEEVSRNMDAALGTDTENWVEAGVWLTVEKTVFSALMRILVGQSVCRNETFRDDISGFTKAFGFNAIFIGRFMPMFLRSTLGYLMSALLLIRQRNLLKRWFNPLVEERFSNLWKKSQDPTFDYNPPQDLITWASDALLTTGNVERCSPNNLSRRLAIMIPAAVPAIKITTTNVIYDILASPPAENVQGYIYNEIVNALDNSPGKGWADQTFLPRLVFLNSTVRETLRYNPVSIVTMERKVIPKEGITLPNGQRLPKGTWLGVPTVGIQRDENIYPNADKYEPFRFCSRKPWEMENEENGATPVTSTGVVNVTDTFLPFGAGKYACPGRWLASHVIKLTVAYLLYSYELKPISQRPLNHALFGTNMPNRQVTMMVRRRKH